MPKDEFDSHAIDAFKNFEKFITTQTCIAIKGLNIKHDIDISWIDELLLDRKIHKKEIDLKVHHHNFSQLCEIVNKELNKISVHPQTKCEHIKNEKHYHQIFNYEIKNEKLKEIVSHLEQQKKIFIIDKYNIKKMNSHEKGLMGEKFFSALNDGEVVGQYGKKTDVVTEDSNVSIKTSYNGSWNHHLAYLSMEKYHDIIQNIEEKKSLSSLHIDWSQFFKSVASNDDTTHLNFQNIIINEGQIKEIQNWKIDLIQIIDILEKKSFIFQKNNILIHQEGELLFKLQFKKRSNGYQLMIITDTDSLNNMIEHDFCEYNHFKQKVSDNKFYF